MTRWCVAFALAIAAMPAVATDIYKWVDADGGIHYGDHPPANVSAAPLVQPTPTRIHSVATPAVAPAVRRRSARGNRARRNVHGDDLQQRCAAYRRRIRALEQRMRHGYAEPAGNRWRARKREWTERLYRECYF